MVMKKSLDKFRNPVKSRYINLTFFLQKRGCPIVLKLELLLMHTKMCLIEGLIVDSIYAELIELCSMFTYRVKLFHNI